MNNLQVQFPQTPLENNTIILSGDFNAIEAMHFKVDLINYISTCQDDFILDIRAIKKMDLTALNALIIAQKEIHKKGQKFTIQAHRNSPIFELLHLTKFERHLNLKIAA